MFCLFYEKGIKLKMKGRRAKKSVVNIYFILILLSIVVIIFVEKYKESKIKTKENLNGENIEYMLKEERSSDLEENYQEGSIDNLTSNQYSEHKINISDNMKKEYPKEIIKEEYERIQSISQTRNS